jgi:D-tyrosyl-tRNA(Tyr) deacylase
MRALIQRVQEARVVVEGQVVGAIDAGLLVLIGVCAEDSESDLEFIARKLPTLRIFPDAEGKMNRSVLDLSLSLLLVSQFTLCASLKKGTRPSFTGAMPPEQANALFELLVTRLEQEVAVEKGVFGADMKVHLINDGPVTLMLDSRRK